jgi:hypothetical protein
MPGIKHRQTLNAAAGINVDLPFKAAGNLSTCQYRFVTWSTVEGEVTGATGGSNPAALGVLQNTPTASQTAIVRLFGKTQITVPATACTLRVGDFLAVGTCGGGLYSGASGMIFGRVISGSVASATAGSLIALVNTITPSGSLNAAS